MKNIKSFIIKFSVITIVLIAPFVFSYNTFAQNGSDYSAGEWANSDGNNSSADVNVTDNTWWDGSGGLDAPAGGEPVGGIDAPAGGKPVGGIDAPAGSDTSIGLKNPLKVKTIGGLIQSAVEIFSYLVIIFAVLAFIWVGLQYVLARGNSDRMKELSKWLGYIAIGVAVVIGARIIISIVINTLESTGTVDQKVIQSANDALNGR